MAGTTLTELPRPLRTIAIVALATIVTSATDFVVGSTGLLPISSQGAGQAGMEWRLDDWQPYLKDVYWRVRMRITTSGTAAPGQDVYGTIYNISPSGANAGAITLGAEVPGARTALTNLALTTTTYSVIGPTTPVPADGLYGLVLHSNAAWAANSGAIITGAVDVFAR